MTGRRSRALVLAVAVSLLGMTTIARADAASPPPQPAGVYEQELPAFGNSIVGAAAGVPLFIGAGTAAQPGLVQISSMADFTQMISDPSPALLAAVQQFYLQGGGDAYMYMIPTVSLPLLMPLLNTTVAGLTPAISEPPAWDLLVIPALSSLSPTDWLTTATQMTATAAAAQATALLDPPDATVAAAQTSGAGPLTTLAQQLRASVSSPGNAVLLSSGLTDADDNPVPGAAVMAGIIATTDESDGLWEPPAGAGDPVNGGLQPVLTVDDALNGALDPSVDAWRVFPGSGTVLWGDRTLELFGPDVYLNAQRTVSWIERSITLALQAYVFAPNTATTWSTVDASISSFLTDLYQEGALGGDRASDAFTVSVGIPSTMTGLDVLNGVMIVEVEVTLQAPTSAPYSVRVEQQMQGQG